MSIKADEISKIIREQIGSFGVSVDVAEVGTVVSLGDGIARVHGCQRAMAGEMLEFPKGVFGIALNLEEDSVGAVLLGEYLEIKEGDPVKRTGRIISVPVGEAMLGRVVNALGQPIDGKGPILTKDSSPIERIDDAPDHRVADGNLDDALGALDRAALLDFEIVAEKHDADFVLFEVERQTRGARFEFEEFAGHHFFESMHLGDPIADLHYRPDLGDRHAGIEVLDLLPNDSAYFFRSDFVGHIRSAKVTE